MTDLEKELLANNKELTQQLKVMQEELQLQREQMQLQLEQIAELTRRLFGRKKETLVPEDQLSLFDEHPFIQAETTEEETVQVIQTYERNRRPKGRKAQLLKEMKEVLVHHELEAEEQYCLKCATDLQPIGQSIVREEPVFVPAHFEKKVHIQHAYECPCCKAKDQDCIVKAPVPRPLLANSLGSPSIVAEVMHQKFEMGVPCYRQEKEWKRHGLLVSRKTMSNWLITTAERYLAPLVALLQEKVLQEDVIHCDETTMNVLESTKSTNYLWLLRSIAEEKQPVVYYHYHESRGAEAIQPLLGNYTGYAHCDGYQLYRNLLPSRVIGCLAHGRRKFFEALGKQPVKESYAAIGMDFCDRLFRVERQLSICSFNQKEVLRLERLLPIFEEFHAWLHSFHPLEKSKLGIAVNYMKKYWEDFVRVLEDGRFALSNNIAERGIRSVVTMRKNFLFSKSKRGAQANATIFSIIETAKANGLDAYQYLLYLFENLPQLPDFVKKSDLEAYLPWHPKIALLCTKKN